MILESIRYTRNESKAKEWSIEGRDGECVRFGNINLIVGKNAVGKSRTLEVIREIANLFSGAIPLSETVCSAAKYSLQFRDKDDVYEYYINYESRKIVDEHLTVNGTEILNRQNNTLQYSLSGDKKKLNLDEVTIAISLHEENSLLKELFNWGHGLRSYAFSNQSAKNYLLDDIKLLSNQSPKDIRNSKSLLSLFHLGKCTFGDEFASQVKNEMAALGYSISMIDTWESKHGYGICVQEEGLETTTNQLDMAQGMYRTLSFVIQLNFAIMSKVSECILVDDLGEGLDFDRSRLLIELISKKVNNSDIQIFITTNDRYVMNKLPLKYWSVIERHSKKSVFYNYYNSQEIFDDFKYTGLNNFDFLTTDFYVKGFESEQE